MYVERYDLKKYRKVAKLNGTFHLCGVDRTAAIYIHPRAGWAVVFTRKFLRRKSHPHGHFKYVAGVPKYRDLDSDTIHILAERLINAYKHGKGVG